MQAFLAYPYSNALEVYPKRVVFFKRRKEHVCSGQRRLGHVAATRPAARLCPARVQIAA